MFPKLDRSLPWLLIGVGAVVLAAAVIQVITSLPPRTFTFLVGRQGGAYYASAQQYQALAAEDGFNLQIVPTAGSVTALQMLQNGQGDAAFIQGGIAATGDPRQVNSLAGVFYEPLWVFYRRDLAASRPLDSPLQLRGARIAIGETGSGTNELTRQILADYEIKDADATLLQMSNDDALRGLQQEGVDAMFVVSNYTAPVVTTLLADPELEMMSLGDAEALARRHRFLQVLTLPRGTFDLVGVRPRADVKMVAPVANLVIRADLHPDLVRLLAFTAVEVHSAGGFFAAPNLFPNVQSTDLPVDKEGETYLLRAKNKEFTLDRYLPFWMSAVVDRYLLFVVPIALILLPLISRSPLLYQVYMGNRINRWYSRIRRIDQGMESLDTIAAVDKHLVECEEIDHKLVAELSVSNSYMAKLYELRQNVEYVQRRLLAKRETLSGGEGPRAGVPAGGAADNDIPNGGMGPVQPKPISPPV